MAMPTPSVAMLLGGGPPMALIRTRELLRNRKRSPKSFGMEREACQVPRQAFQACQPSIGLGGQRRCSWILHGNRIFWAWQVASLNWWQSSEDELEGGWWGYMGYALLALDGELCRSQYINPPLGWFPQRILLCFAASCPGKPTPWKWITSHSCWILLQYTIHYNPT